MNKILLQCDNLCKRYPIATRAITTTCSGSIATGSAAPSRKAPMIGIKLFCTLPGALPPLNPLRLYVMNKILLQCDNLCKRYQERWPSSRLHQC
jgi:hypothetical protein